MKPYKLTWQNHELELGFRTCIMGILNVTPDSFSDGGSHYVLDAALSHAEKMISDGADILDIGGESSRPFSKPVSAEEETRRVLPVIEYLAGKIDIPISIDTTKAVVARRAMDAGASVINDISALKSDPEMGSVAAKADALIILMHMLGTPRTMQVNPQYTDLIGDIFIFLENAVKKATAAGVRRSSIVVDPGIGFGKNVSHNLELIEKINMFSSLDVPVLIGPSRKAFIRKLLAEDALLENENDSCHDLVETGTQAAVSAAILNGAHMIRVHNVARARATAKIIDSIKNDGFVKSRSLTAL